MNSYQQQQQNSLNGIQNNDTFGFQNIEQNNIELNFLQKLQCDQDTNIDFDTDAILSRKNIKDKTQKQNSYDNDEQQFFKYDSFGFEIEQEKAKEYLIYLQNQKQYAKRNNARIEKWKVKIIPKLKQYQNSKSNTLKQKVRKGIPNCIRSICWKQLAKIEEAKEILYKQYPSFKYNVNNLYNIQILIKLKENIIEDVIKESYNSNSSKISSQIYKEVILTFQKNQFFKNTNEHSNEYKALAELNEGQLSLTIVLRNLAQVLPKMGYTQGINYIVGILLLFLDNEVCLINFCNFFFKTAFWVAYSILKVYKMQEYFIDNLMSETIKKHIFILNKLFQKQMPQLFQHFVNFINKAKNNQIVQTLGQLVCRSSNVLHGMVHDNLLKFLFSFQYNNEDIRLIFY